MISEIPITLKIHPLSNKGPEEVLLHVKVGHITDKYRKCKRLMLRSQGEGRREEIQLAGDSFSP